MSVRRAETKGLALGASTLLGVHPSVLASPVHRWCLPPTVPRVMSSFHVLDLGPRIAFNLQVKMVLYTRSATLPIYLLNKSCPTSNRFARCLPCCPTSIAQKVGGTGAAATSLFGWPFRMGRPETYLVTRAGSVGLVSRGGVACVRG